MRILTSTFFTLLVVSALISGCYSKSCNRADYTVDDTNDITQQK